MEAFFELSYIWIGVFFSAFLAKKSKLTPVLFYLATGAIFVNTGIIPEHAPEFIEQLGELGIILIMLAIGFEENTDNFMGSIKRSWGIAFFGALAPFVTAYGLAHVFWADSNISLFCGLTMTATAVSLTMVSLKDVGLHKTPAATGIMTSAVLDDIAALALVAIIVPIASGEATLSLMGVSAIVGKAIFFFILVSLIGVFLLPHDKEKGWLAEHFPMTNKIGIGHLINFDQGKYATLMVLLLALIVGLLAHEFGFHPAIGAYMAGLILKEEYFSNKQLQDSTTYKSTLSIIDDAAFVWIGPVFFVILGSRIILDTELLLHVLPYVGILVVCLITSQIGAAALAARYTGKFDWPDSLLIGIGMVGRAELAFVVIDIAYVQYNILSKEAFYTLMITIFWLNVAVPVSIALWRKRFPEKANVSNL